MAQKKMSNFSSTQIQRIFKNNSMKFHFHSFAFDIQFPLLCDIVVTMNVNSYVIRSYIQLDFWVCSTMSLCLVIIALYFILESFKN